MVMLGDTAELRRTSIRWCALAAVASLTALRADEPVQQGSPQRIYLDEFRPRAELRAPATDLRRARFPCVNVHTHPEQTTDAELDEMVTAMDTTNIAVSVSLDGRTGNRGLEHLHRLEARHPGRFVVFLRMDYVGDGREDDPASWDVHRPDFGARMADRLTEAVRHGMCGLKLLKDLGLTVRDAHGRLIAPDDPRFDPVWERAAELRVPVLWHCADPVAFFRPIDVQNERYEELSRHPEWSFHGGDFPTHQSLIDARLRVIARHPQTTFVCAHMADIPEDLAQLGRQLDAHPNMYVEIAARVSELGRQPYTARTFFLRYQDRILFGTDGVPPVTELDPHWRFLETWDEFFPYEDNPFPPQGFWNIYGLGLPDEVLHKVYHANAARLIPGVRERLVRAAQHAPPEPRP
jgi:predicted TIM-barrel fold metal-dependent hydrolase